MRPPGTNLGQREVKGSKVEGHEHVLLLGIPKSISPWKGAVSELTEPVALFLRVGEAPSPQARLALTPTSWFWRLTALTDCFSPLSSHSHDAGIFKILLALPCRQWPRSNRSLGRVLPFHNSSAGLAKNYTVLTSSERGKPTSARDVRRRPRWLPSSHEKWHESVSGNHLRG